MIEDIKAALMEDSRIDFVLLFGSRARAQSRPGSDLDIAICLSPSCTDDPLDVRLDIMARLSHKVDVVLTSQAPPALAFRIARDGSVVFCRDPRTVTNFRARAYSMYPDWERFISIHEKAMLERIDGGTYGR
jgi:predicted nucleotidyltransferase